MRPAAPRDAPPRAAPGLRRRRVVAALRRALEIVRDEGLWSTWCKLLALLGYRRVLVFVRSLDHELPPVTTGVPVTVAMLTEAEVEEYCAFQPGAEPATIRRRLSDGHRCFAARVDGTIVHASWGFVGKAPVPFLGRDLALAPDEVFADGSYTARAFRGHNIAAARSEVMLRHFRAQGYRRALSVVFPESRPAIRAIEKVGYRPVATMGYVKLWRWRRDFYRVHGGGPPRGDALGRGNRGR